MHGDVAGTDGCSHPVHAWEHSCREPVTCILLSSHATMKHWRACHLLRNRHICDEMHGVCLAPLLGACRSPSHCKRRTGCYGDVDDDGDGGTDGGSNGGGGRGSGSGRGAGLRGRSGGRCRGAGRGAGGSRSGGAHLSGRNVQCTQSPL